MPSGTARADPSAESTIYTGMNDSPPKKTQSPIVSNLYYAETQMPKSAAAR